MAAELIDREFDGAVVGLSVTDAAGRFLRVNPAFCTLTGFPESHLLVSSVRDLTHPDDAPAHQKLIEQLVSGEVAAVLTELRMMHASGAIVRLLVNASLMSAPHGQAPRIMAVSQEYDAMLAPAVPMPEGVEAFVPAVLWSAKPDGSIEYASPYWTRYTGLTHEATIGWGWTSRVHPDDVARATAVWERAIMTGEPARVEYRVRRVTDGVYRWFQANAVPLRDAGGRVVRWHGTLVDIQERRDEELHGRARARLASEEELVTARRRAEDSTRATSDFLGRMSHELRTPLNSIIGFTGILLMEFPGPLNPEQKNQLQMVSGSANLLVSLINDLLALAELEAGKVEITRETITVAELVDAAVAASKASFDARGLTCETDVPNQRILLRTDREKCHRIIMNLLNHAGKQMTAGACRVTAALREDRVEIAVTDTGPGLPPEVLAGLFLPYGRPHGQATRRLEGTGLSINVSYHLARALGGSLRAESELGKGACFTLSLPVEGGR